MSSKLFDTASGKWVEVPDTQTDELVRKGTHTFESGIEVPVVSPEGKLGTVPSENANQAFAEGFRWQTPADREKDYAIKTERIKEKAYGNQSGTAAAMGALETYTGGLSDAVLPDDLKEAAGEVRERNPLAHTAGSLAGLALPGGAMGVASELGAGAEAAGIAGRLAPGASKAARVVARVTDKMLGSAVEGAFVGGTNGVSEAALGKPEEAADHIISNIGMGALIGGGFGALSGGITESGVIPALKSAVEGVADKGADVVKSVAKGVLKPVGMAGLIARGEGKLAGEFAEFADNPGALDLATQGKFGEAKRVMREAEGVRADFEKESRQLESDLLNKMKTTTKGAKQELVDGMAAAKGNLQETMSNIYSGLQKSREDFTGALESNYMQGQPAQFVEPAIRQGEALVGTLERSSVKGAKALAGDVKSFMKANIGEELGAIPLSAADEGRVLLGIRDFARQTEAKLGTTSTGKGAVEVLDNLMENHPLPAVKEAFENIVKRQDALDALQSVIGNSVKDRAYRGIAGVLQSPEKLEALQPLLNNLAEYAPEIKAFQEAGPKIQDQVAALSAAREKLAQSLQSSVSGKLSIDDMEHVFKILSPERGDVLKNIDRYRQISESLQGVEKLDPLSAAAAMMRAAGKDVGEVEKMIPYQKHMETWDKLNRLSEANPIAKGMLATGLGYALGGRTGVVAANLARAATSPTSALKTLATVGRIADQGAAKFTKYTNQFIDTALSNKTNQIVVRTVTEAPSEKAASLEQRRKQFTKLTKQLQMLSTPEGIVDHVSQAGGTLQHIPNVKLHMQIRLQGAVNFLNSKIPQDPLATTSIFGKSKWEPSDQELSTFNRYVDAVDKPLTVVKDIAHGQVVPEQIEALKTVYPDMYARLQTNVMNGIVDHGEEIPYSGKLLLNQVFDVPTDYSLTPQFIGDMQSMFAQQDQGKQEAAQVSRPKSKLKINPMTTVATEATKITEGKYGNENS